MSRALSDDLMATIVELFQTEELQSFSLGGGTNLALKYAYRISTDIDLFSNEIVGLEKMQQIEKVLKDQYKNKIQIELLNKEIDHLCFLKAIIETKNEKIKVEIIQNLKFIYEPQLVNEVRLIHDFDIAPLKLLAFASRGSRKDLYDLFFLSNKYELEVFYDLLQDRLKKFPINIKDNQNIFNIPTSKPKDYLENSLSALGNFNKAKDLKNSSNRVNLFDNDFFNDLPFPVLCNHWVKMVKDLALKKG